MARKLEEWQHLLRELRAEFILREEELELLHAIDLRLLEEELSLEETLAFIIEKTNALLRSEHASILLRRGPILEVAYSSDGLDIGKNISIPGSIPGKCLTEQASILITDLRTDPLEEAYVPIKGYEGRPIRSLVEVPIIWQGNPIGALCAESSRATAFRPVHARTLRAIASQVAIALQNVQYFKSAALFADVDQIIISPVDTQFLIQRALQRVVHELRKLYRVELAGAQILFRKGSDELEIVHSTNPADIGLTVSVADSICGRSVRDRATIIVGDVSKDSQYRRMLGSAIQSEIAIPIKLADSDAIIGVLNVESEEIDAFSGFNKILLESFADKVRVLLAFTKLRTDVTEALESRHASDLLIAVGDQTSNLIHRLNNSVGALRAKILELQEDSEEDPPPLGKDRLRDALGELLELADHTLEMPEQVTRFLSHDRNTIGVNKVITEILQETSIPANITVETDLHSELPELALYSFDIVVQNLIRNAVDAMTEGGGHLYVSTTLVSHQELPSGYVQMIVRDSGTGIASDILPHIFELNFTTKHSKGKGLGLGLWWVRAFVVRSRGEISVNSQRDIGTEFCIKVPVSTPMSDELVP